MSDLIFIREFLSLHVNKPWFLCECERILVIIGMHEKAQCFYVTKFAKRCIGDPYYH